MTLWLFLGGWRREGTSNMPSISLIDHFVLGFRPPDLLRHAVKMYGCPAEWIISIPWLIRGAAPIYSSGSQSWLCIRITWGFGKLLMSKPLQQMSRFGWPGMGPVISFHKSSPGSLVLRVLEVMDLKIMGACATPPQIMGACEGLWNGVKETKERVGAERESSQGLWCLGPVYTPQPSVCITLCYPFETPFHSL